MQLINIGRLLIKSCRYVVIALADRYIIRLLPLKRDKNLVLLGR